MKPTGVIDLHCDTITKIVHTDEKQDWNGIVKDKDRWNSLLNDAYNKNSLDIEERAFALSRIPENYKWVQCFAVFIPDELRGNYAAQYCETFIKSFYRQINLFDDRISACRCFDEIEQALRLKKVAAILTIEGGAALCGDLSRISLLADMGVKILTLTWNGENELGSGNKSDKGLTVFGIKAVTELEKNNVIIDASHLNDRGFYDLCEIANKPFIASHSNSRSVCKHQRNLTDGQVLEIVKRKGIIGLNFYLNFLRDDAKPAGFDDIYRHIMRFVELGAQKCLALGSDFDGADMPKELSKAEDILRLREYLSSRGINDAALCDIMFDNAYRFFKDNLR